MSTKTSFKRIALVAASALAIAGFSAVPANAALVAQGSAPFTPDFNGTATTVASPFNYIVNQYAGASNFVSFTANANVTSTSSTLTSVSVAITGGSLKSGKGAGVTCTKNNQPTTVVGSTYSTGVWTANSSGNTDWLASNWDDTDCDSKLGNGGGYNDTNPFSANFTIGTPTVGTITAQVYANEASSGVVTSTLLQTFTIIVGAAPATLYAKTSLTQTLGLLPDAKGTIHKVSDEGGTAATFTAVQKDSTDAPLATPNSKAVLVTLTGSAGSLSASGPSSSYLAIPAATWVNDGSGTVSVYADGRTGNATLTVSVNGSVAATQDFNFYSSKVASITAVAFYSIAPINGVQSGYLNGQAADCSATTGLPASAAEITTATSFSCVGSTSRVAIALISKDKDGNVVPVVPTMSSSDNGVVVSGNTASFIDNGQSLASAGWGFVHSAYKTAVASTSGQKASLTYSYVNTDGSIITSNVVAVTLGGSIAKEVMTLDSASYEPGAPMILTMTATDSKGNPVYDGAATAASFTSNKSVNGLTTFTGGRYVGGKYSSKANVLFVPATTGDFTIFATGADSAATVLSLTATVEKDQDASLALDAANAATDAANNAYDEAQNATQAASDALAAVTALAAQVKSLIAMVKKLTKAVAKMNKKK